LQFVICIVCFGRDIHYKYLLSLVNTLSIYAYSALPYDVPKFDSTVALNVLTKYIMAKVTVNNQML